MLTDEQIRVAVDWWADAIQDPDFDNGDTSSMGGTTALLANLLSESHPVTPEKVEKFKTALTNLLKTTKVEDDYFTLSVDYHPCSDLCLCAQVAEIDESRFPWKTRMYLDKGGVSVSAGYAAPLEKLL